MDTLAEIEERHNAVQEIEKQLQELHQMFLDMAVLVDAQGELLDDIEGQVTSAVDHVSEGTKQLVVARKTQLNTRKVRRPLGATGTVGQWRERPGASGGGRHRLVKNSSL